MLFRSIIDNMRQKPSKRVMMMRGKDWDPLLEPDVLVYNSVRAASEAFLVIYFSLVSCPNKS